MRRLASHTLDQRRGRSGIIVVVVVVVITLGAIPEITDESSADVHPPGTNAVAVAATAVDDDDVAQTDEPLPKRRTVGLRGRWRGRFVHRDRRRRDHVRAYGGDTARGGAAGAEAPGTTARLLFSTPARLRLPARRLLLGESASPPSSATISIARATPRPQPPSTDSRERMRTTPPPSRADRARRDARALERQNARGREKRRGIYGKKALVFARHDISRAVRGGRNGQGWFGQGRARGRSRRADAVVVVRRQRFGTGVRVIIAHVDEGLAREVRGPQISLELAVAAIATVIIRIKIERP